jgi:NAD(P)-dependent dehydrogenase (short-subunit alcohol dehydrogenase family)
MAVVLITGCSSGFGRRASLSFARQGHTVFATVRAPERAEDLVEIATSEDLDLHVVRLDVRDVESVEAAVDEVLERAGRIDVCVNNAGIELRGPIEECADDEVLQQFDTNVFGVLRVVRAVLPSMRGQGSGVIVNVSSIAGLVARPFAGMYAASKHALEAITESLHFEVAPFGIRVHAVEPGQFETDLGANAITAARYTDASPYREAADALDVAIRRLAPDGKPAPADIVADAIVEVALDADAPLRRLVGDDAELIWSVRTSGDFEHFEQTMRAALDWQA